MRIPKSRSVFRGGFAPNSGLLVRFSGLFLLKLLAWRSTPDVIALNLKRLIDGIMFPCPLLHPMKLHYLVFYLEALVILALSNITNI